MAKYKVEFPNAFLAQGGYDYAFEGAYEGTHGYCAIYSKIISGKPETAIAAYEVWLIGTNGVRVPKNEAFGNTAWSFKKMDEALAKAVSLGFKDAGKDLNSEVAYEASTPTEVKPKHKAAVEPKPAAEPKVPKAPKVDGSISFKELATQTLQAAGEASALTVEEMWAKAEGLGLVAKLATKGATPKATLSAFLGVQSKKPDGFVDAVGGRPAKYTLRKVAA